MAIFGLLDRIDALPHGVANGVVGPGEVVGEALATDPRVDKISFTGSSEVGRRLMELGARTFKRVSLEAGGKAPVIVFPDANLEKAMDAVAVGIFLYAGQSCTAGSRLLIERSLHDRFIEGLVERAAALKVGSPLDDATQLGPMVSRRQLDRVLGYVERGRAEGARLVTRRRAARRRVVVGLLDGADDLRRRRAIDVDRARGDLRAGPVGHRVRHGGRGARARQRQRVRARQRGLDERPRPGDPRSPGGCASATCGSTRITSGSPRARSAGVKQSGIGRELGMEGLDAYLESKRVCIDSSPTFHMR